MRTVPVANDAANFTDATRIFGFSISKSANRRYECPVVKWNRRSEQDEKLNIVVDYSSYCCPSITTANYSSILSRVGMRCLGSPIGIAITPQAIEQHFGKPAAEMLKTTLDTAVEQVLAADSLHLLRNKPI